MKVEHHLPRRPASIQHHFAGDSETINMITSWRGFLDWRFCMRYAAIGFLLASMVPQLPSQQTPEGPTSEKAQKAYKEAVNDLKKNMVESALDNFKKADKQDGGHGPACQKQMIKYALELRDWKTAETAADEMVADAKSPKDVALVHYQSGIVLFREGL